MATVNDIIDAQDDAIAEVDAQLKVTTKLQPGAGGQVDDAINRMMAKKSAIRAETVTNLIAHPDFAAALIALQAATRGMNDTAKTMKTVAGVVGKLNDFLGFGTGAINAIKSLKKP